MARIQGEKTEVKYSKLDIIERHITAAIQMIALECNPFSTHVIVKATHELVEVIANKRGVLLDWDPRVWIKDEHLGHYRKLANKGYNYLKHANWDSEEPYDGPKVNDLFKLNEVLALFNLNGYKALGGYISPAFVDFSLAVMLQYPQYFKKEFVESLPGVKEHLQTASSDPEIILMALRQRLRQHKLLPTN
jgi:hypothetical protein